MADITGTINNDILVGSSDPDTINGLAGNDSLYGAAGNDTVNGDDGDDFLNGNDGDDILNGGEGADNLQGGGGVDQHFGGNGDDVIFINQLDYLAAGEIYDGGAGTDKFQMNISFGSIFNTVDLSTSTFNSIEVLEALSSSFVMSVKLTMAQLQSLSEVTANVVLASGGTLLLSGVTFNGSLTLSDTGTTVVATGVANSLGGGVSVTGGAGVDQLTGSAQADYLAGGAGNDTLVGDDGDDTLKGGLGIDSISGGAGSDIVQFGAPGEVVAGEIIDGGSGYDKLRLTLDNFSFDAFDFTTSTLTGIEAIEQVNAYIGIRLTVAQLSVLQAINGPVQVAGTGDVSLAGISAENTVFTLGDGVTGFSTVGMIATSYGANGVQGGNNDNVMTSGDLGDYFFGNGGNDTLTGNGGDDQLTGGIGNDTLNGGAGNDILIGGDGIDNLSGGDGDDILRVESGEAVSGETYAGGIGRDTLELGNNAINLSLQTITGIEVLDAGFYQTARLTVAQYAQFDTLIGHFALADNGALSLAGKTLINFQFDLSATGGTVDFTGATYTFANIFGGAGADNVTAGDGNDSLNGAGGNDTLNGAGGNDGLYGGAGTDILNGGDGDDIFLILDASDMVAGESYNGGAGFDTFTVYAVANIDITGINLIDIEKFNLEYSNTITLTVAQLDSFLDIGKGTFKLSNAGSVSLAGVASNNAIFTLSAAGNTLDLRGFMQNGTFVAGGVGNDTVWGTAGNDIINGSDGTDWISGEDGDDSVSGGAGIDQLYGGAGNDTLSGGSGADSHYGGVGNDTYNVEVQGDLVFEAAGEGIDTVNAVGSYYLYQEIENLVLVAGGGNLFGVGNDLANTITGNEGANLLIAGAGADTVNAGAGNDTIYGQAGADTINGEAGIDYIAGGADSDVINGGDNADELHGEDGDDTLTGGSGNFTDIMTGGAGNDVLYANSGLGDYDILNGGAGNDIYYVDTPNDIIYEAAGEGTDTVHADINGAGYYLWAHVENAVLIDDTPFAAGNDLDNTLTGSNLANWLLGNNGNDRLDGRGGNDVLFGDMPGGTAGADTFVFRPGEGQDVIGDFHHGEDKIEFIGLYSSFAEVQANFSQNGNDGAINLGNGSFIVLQGVTMSTLTATDFIFG